MTQGLKARAVELLAAQIPSAWDISDPTKPCDVTAAQALRAIEAALSSTPSPSLPSREAIALAEQLREYRGGDCEYRDLMDKAADAILSFLPVNGWREGVEVALCWLRAALDCPNYHWDADQREAAEHAYAQARALSAAPGEGAGG